MTSLYCVEGRPKMDGRVEYHGTERLPEARNLKSFLLSLGYRYVRITMKRALPNGDGLWDDVPEELTLGVRE